MGDTDRSVTIPHSTPTYIPKADITVWYVPMGGRAAVGLARVMGDGAVELSSDGPASWYACPGRHDGP